MTEQELLEMTRDLANLDLAFRWAMSQTPRVIPDDVVIQDEYTHDVLFRVREDQYLVFDAT